MKLLRNPLPEAWRRLPVVTLGLALVWLLAALTLEVGFSTRLREADHRLITAARFALQHPEVAVEPRLLPVARQLMPGFESNEMFDFLRRKRPEPGGSQEQFDELSAAGLAAADAHPYRRLGVVPAAVRPAAFLTHLSIHSGTVHVLVNVLLLLLTAPLLERLWGRGVFSAALLGWGILAAGVFTLGHYGSDRALVGGSALVAGCVVAVCVRFRTQEIDFLAWLAPLIAAELSAPAIAILPLWAVGEALTAWGVPGAFTGLDNAVGWAAHGFGAALGGGTAFAVQKAGWEQRFGSPVATAARGSESDAARFAHVKALRAKGDRQAALAALASLVERSPGHRDAVTLWFAWAVEEQQAERAAPAVVELLRHELRRGAADMALAQWTELAAHVPDLEVVPDVWLQLAASAERAGAEETLLVLLQSLVDAQPDAAVLARVAKQAAGVSPELAVRAARAALATGELGDARRRELEAVRARFVSGEEGGGPLDREAEPKPEPPPNVFYEESDRSAFGDVDDLSSLDDFPRGVLVEARPLALGADGLRVQVSEQQPIEVTFRRVRAVSMAGVHGLGPKPVVLVDLLLDGGGDERPLSVLRLRSDGFDPRRLLADAAAQPLDALRSVVARLLAASAGMPLPDAEGAAGRPMRVFASLDAYTEQVLRPAALELS